MAASPTRRVVLRRVGAAVALIVVVAAGYHFFWRYHIKRFDVVREGVFYRVAQPTEFGIRHMAEHHHVHTLLSLRRYDPRLHQGLIDLGDPDGSLESSYTTSLGVHHVQWPMGDTVSWPWPTPWQFDEFFRLLDDRANWPVAVHCMGGRHRAGTLSALFRIEYDRWPVERALEEMYSYKFGVPILLQEHNLRTYLPRPRPDAATWERLRNVWSGALDGPAPRDFDELVYRVRTARASSDASASAAIETLLVEQLERGGPFALPLAARLIDSPDDAVAGPAARAATACLEDSTARVADLSTSAALVADFGTREQQSLLIARMTRHAAEPESNPSDDAVNAGVMNRYTPNRIAFLAALLNDTRHHLAPAAARYRYCDTATTRMTAILDQRFVADTSKPTASQWDAARVAVRAWLDDHPDEAQLRRLLPATGETVVRKGDAPRDEDVSHMRR